MSVMSGIIRVALHAFAALCLTGSIGWAQSGPKQIKLTEKHVEGFIAAQQDMSAVVAKMQAGAAGKPDAAYQAELEAVTKKHGFRNFSEYEDVAATISIVMASIDPQSKTFMEPQTAIAKEIDSLRADATLAEEEKKQLLEELQQALKAAQPIQHPSNIELVRKYYDRIDAALG
jgi:hypothetical protein